MASKNFKMVLNILSHPQSGWLSRGIQILANTGMDVVKGKLLYTVGTVQTSAAISKMGLEVSQKPRNKILICPIPEHTPNGCYSQQWRHLHICVHCCFICKSQEMESN